MKANYLLALVSAAAVGAAFVLSFEAGFGLLVLIGVAAIATADYARTLKPLAVQAEPVAARASHELRLAV
jgi:hypothetical protein